MFSSLEEQRAVEQDAVEDIKDAILHWVPCMTPWDWREAEVTVREKLGEAYDIGRGLEGEGALIVYSELIERCAQAAFENWFGVNRLHQHTWENHHDKKPWRAMARTVLEIAKEEI